MAGLLAAGLLVAAPAPAAQAGYVKYPKAVPGQFCKKALTGQKARTPYGVLTCRKSGQRSRWKR